MKELAILAINIAKQKRATYADVRIVEDTYENITLKNDKIQYEKSTSLGIGIRVIVNGAWGFASTNDLKRKSIESTVALAIDTAKSSSITKKRDVTLAENPVYKDVWKTPIIKDPFSVSISEKLALLSKINKNLRKVKGVTIATSSMSFRKKYQIFVNSQGSEIEQTIIRSGAGYSATATKNGEIQIRSYPQSFGGQFMTKGYELIESLNLIENTQRIAEEAVALLSAKKCPQGKKDIIIGSSQLALQIHESCGHPAELDRVFGDEASFAGTSFLTPDKLGKFKYGSSLVSIVADTISEGGLGTFGYDDEGVKAQKWYIVKDGIFVGYLTSRETAKMINSLSNGCMRAQSWKFIPLIRMVNISLVPGKGKLQELINDTKDGIYLEGTRSWSIDQKRLNFHFAGEIAWEIKNGKITQILKNPTYQGITYEFWNSCDAICGEEEWTLWGIPSCGKGEPVQIAEVSHGASPARFRKCNIGV
jgi:TldD protein